MVRGIAQAVTGATIQQVRKSRCRYRPILIEPGIRNIQRRVVDRTVIEVFRRAKRVVLHLEGHEYFVIEPRMTGLMLLADPPDADHLRIEWRLRKAGREFSLWFYDRRGLGTFRLWNQAEFTEKLGPSSIGIDALEMTATDWKVFCQRTSRPIKVALLEQKYVAGIGNLYASEILHRARIHPETSTASLSAPMRKRLHEATRTILLKAIEYEGSTLSDGTYRNALNKDGGYQNEHQVYNKANQNCPRCGTTKIERIVQAQRSTFFCPQCQVLKT